MSLQCVLFNPRVPLWSAWLAYPSTWAYSYTQILTKLSHPPVASFGKFPVVWDPEDTRLPGVEAEAQLAALHPIPCALKTFVSQVPSSLNSRIETLPSLDAQANKAPKSWGAQPILFTDEVWRGCCKSFDHADR